MSTYSISKTQAVANYFRKYPGRWIDGQVLARIGGRYAWRTRVSNARRQLGMQIDNRLLRKGNLLGKSCFIASEYRYVPGEELC